MGMVYFFKSLLIIIFYSIVIFLAYPLQSYRQGRRPQEMLAFNQALLS